jgi:hypothetical protein
VSKKKMLAVVVAGVAWGVAFCNLIPGVPVTLTMFALALAVAVVASGYVMVHCYQRPLGDAYTIGYEMGRRDAMLAANRRDVSPIRREPRGLGAFNIEALKSKPIRERDRVDA